MRTPGLKKVHHYISQLPKTKISSSLDEKINQNFAFWKPVVSKIFQFVASLAVAHWIKSLASKILSLLLRNVNKYGSCGFCTVCTYRVKSFINFTHFCSSVFNGKWMFRMFFYHFYQIKYHNVIQILISDGPLHYTLQNMNFKVYRNIQFDRI